MTGQYSTRSFFRLMPNALLARYFNEKGLFGDIDFAVMNEGSLDLNFRGSKKPVEPLQGMFANAILKLDELPPDPKDERIYDLSCCSGKILSLPATLAAALLRCG